MKKLLLLSLFAIATVAHGTSLRKQSPNIIPLDKLMLHSIVAENASQDLAERFPEYASWLTDTDAVLLLNFINTTDKTVIIKFSADWCAPCKRLAPIVHDAATEYFNDVIVIEVNIDYAPTLREMFNVEVVPTLIYFKNGAQVDRTNSVSKATLLDKIKTLIDQKSVELPH